MSLLAVTQTIFAAAEGADHSRVIDWLFYVLLGLMSLTALTLVIWRILLNLGARTDLNEFLPAFQKRLEKEGVEGALRWCRSRTDAIPRRLYVAGLETSKQGLAAMRRAMANVAELEIVPDLNFLLPLILAIAKVATMVGLLGTVVSMINTFQGLKDAGASVTDKADTIGLALIATALGLVTAIPLAFSHVLFKAWANRFELKMKSAAQKLFVLVQAAKASGQPGRAGEAAERVAANPGIRR